MALGTLLMAPNVRRNICFVLVILDLCSVLIGAIWITIASVMCEIFNHYSSLKDSSDNYAYSMCAAAIFSVLVHGFGAYSHLSATDWREVYLHQKFFSSSLFLNIVLKLADFISYFVYGLMMYKSTEYFEEIFGSGIKKRMEEYSVHLNYKMQIDNVQQSYQCCGAKTHKDWYNVRWYREEYFVGELNDSMRRLYMINGYFEGSPVPFSCCDVKSYRPCVYIFTREDGMVPNYDHRHEKTLYLNGCGKAMGHQIGWFIDLFGLLLVYFNIVQAFNLLVSRFVQTAIQTGMDHGDPTQTSYGYIFSCGIPLRPPGALSDYDGMKKKNDLLYNLATQATDLDALANVKMAELDRYTMEAAYQERKFQKHRKNESKNNDNLNSSNVDSIHEVAIDRLWRRKARRKRKIYFCKIKKSLTNQNNFQKIMKKNSSKNFSKEFVKFKDNG